MYATEIVVRFVTGSEIVVDSVVDFGSTARKISKIPEID